MTRTFTVTLEDMTQYAVTASYSVSFEQECFGCWLDVHAIKPLTKSAIALTDERIDEIESALSYLIVDECEDLSSYNESRFEC